MKDDCIDSDVGMLFQILIFMHLAITEFMQLHVVKKMWLKKMVGPPKERNKHEVSGISRRNILFPIDVVLETHHEL